MSSYTYENCHDLFQLEEFSTLETSAYTLFRMILGDFNFKNIETASPLFGVVFFLSYIFFVFFVLLVSLFEKHKIENYDNQQIFQE